MRGVLIRLCSFDGSLPAAAAAAALHGTALPLPSIWIQVDLGQGIKGRRRILTEEALVQKPLSKLYFGIFEFGILESKKNQKEILATCCQPAERREHL